MGRAHDLGGREGFGPVLREADEPVFHAAWEARMFALASALPFALPYSDDHFRSRMERMPAADYAAASYYERWYAAVQRLLQERGVTTGALPAAAAPLRPEAVPAAIAAGASQSCPPAAPPRFRPGDRVRTRLPAGGGHTRLPAYAAGREGRVARVQGVFLLADAHADSRREPQWLYGVVFAARSLWPEAGEGDEVALDLWDSYLGPA